MPALPDAAKTTLYDTMLAYATIYTLKDNKVVHHVDATWNPAWVGMDLVRPHTLSGAW